MEAILVAAIGAIGAVLAAMIQAFRKENKQDHALVSNALNRLETKLDGHINDHAVGVYSAEPQRRKASANVTKIDSKRSTMGNKVSKKSGSSRN